MFIADDFSLIEIGPECSSNRYQLLLPTRKTSDLLFEYLADLKFLCNIFDFSVFSFTTSLFHNKYTSSDGNQSLKNGNLVKVDTGYNSDKGAETIIYRYLGSLARLMITVDGEQMSLESILN